MLDEGQGNGFGLNSNSSSYLLYLATSAVDLDTDQAIQGIIQGPAFKDVTILTIAYVSIGDI